jgi:hypothetical protein
MTPGGLTVNQWAMLMRLAEFGTEECPIPGGVGWCRTVNSLQKRGLVRRPGNTVELTASGRQLLAQHGAL